MGTTLIEKLVLSGARSSRPDGLEHASEEYLSPKKTKSKIHIPEVPWKFSTSQASHPKFPYAVDKFDPTGAKELVAQSVQAALPTETLKVLAGHG
jgi:hypothetical protein